MAACPPICSSACGSWNRRLLRGRQHRLAPRPVQRRRAGRRAGQQRPPIGICMRPSRICWASRLRQRTQNRHQDHNAATGIRRDLAPLRPSHPGGRRGAERHRPGAAGERGGARGRGWRPPVRAEAHSEPGLIQSAGSPIVRDTGTMRGLQHPRRCTQRVDVCASGAALAPSLNRLWVCPGALRRRSPPRQHGGAALGMSGASLGPCRISRPQA